MDPETKSIYEIISCWFVNKYWGNMYYGSRDGSQDTYKSTVITFNNSFKSTVPNRGRYDTPYVIIMEKICNYYNEEYSRNKDIHQFISSIYKVIVGEKEAMEHNANFEDQENVVQNVLTEAVNVFSIWIIGNELEAVERRDNERPIEWKNKFITIFKNGVKRFRHIIVAQRNGVDVSKHADKEMVPVEIVEKLKSKIRDLYGQLRTITVERNQLAMLAKQYRNMLEQYMQAELPSNVVEVESDDLVYVDVEEEELVEVEEDPIEFSSGDEFSFDI